MFWVSLIEKFGFPITCVIATVLFAVWLVKYILREYAKREEYHRKLEIEQQDKYHLLVSNHLSTSTKIMEQITHTLSEMRSSNNEAHKYQREEHMKMIEKLVSITR